MLRGKIDTPGTLTPAPITRPPPPSGEDTGIPSVEQPYATGERPPGIVFYRAKNSFWLPYHLLQRMEFEADQLKLVFATEDIVIRGRSLHPLYIELTRQTVSRIVEQGERYAALSEAGTLVSGIERSPHMDDPQQQQ